MTEVRGLRYTEHPPAVVLMNDKNGVLGKTHMRLGMSVYSHHPKNEDAMYAYGASGKLVVLGGTIEQFLDIVTARETSISSFVINKGRAITPEVIASINAHPARKMAPSSVLVL